MASVLRGQNDQYVDALAKALTEYEAEHPGAEASLYRQNPGSVRIRVVSSHFAGLSRSRRHDEVWAFLSARLDEDTLSEISILLLLAPAELARSLANMDYEDPQPSRL
jgi:stress-induced morphogen